MDVIKQLVNPSRIYVPVQHTKNDNGVDLSFNNHQSDFIVNSDGVFHNCCGKSSSSIRSLPCSAYSGKWKKPTSIAKSFSEVQELDKSYDNKIFSNFDVQYNREIGCISYAGCRFHRPPKPNALPKPPSHWFMNPNLSSVNHVHNNDCLDGIAIQLKGLLKVQS